MVLYKTPEREHFRIHHIRPRFKNNVERVLLFVASEISDLDPMNKRDFDSRLNRALRLFPGNATATEKTINNWRTEISSLFAFIIQNPKTLIVQSGAIARRLEQRQDLVEFFKLILYSFQYPGGHLKPHETKRLIDKGIRFKPAQYILKLLYAAEKSGKRFGINKAEAAHCIFNDLRVTRDNCDVGETIALIERNRKRGLDYDWRGDVIRYAGDILDYLLFANLLVKHGNQFYINKVETEAILKFISSHDWFSDYDKFYSTTFNASNLKVAQNAWFDYVNGFADKLKFETDVLSYIGADISLHPRPKADRFALAQVIGKLRKPSAIKTKEIGDAGEGLVHGHECMRLKLGKRGDLISKVSCIPNYLAMGYDIRSFELDAEARLIEVKTTISNSKIEFNQFHLSDNEWNAATSYKEKYYIYRLLISRTGIKLFILRNPVKLFKEGLVSVALAHGADVKFSERAGRHEELLKWVK
jgi:hypothetical protein